MGRLLSFAFFLLGLACFAAALWLLYDAATGGFPLGSAEEKINTAGKILVQILALIGAWYCLVVKTQHEYRMEQVRAEIERKQKEADAKTALAMAPQLKWIETVANSAQKFNELLHEDEFRRRARRDEALIAFSKSVNITTRAFRHLTSLRTYGSTSSGEQLVNALSPALAARQKFLEARDGLDDLHVVHKDDEKTIREYSILLVNIIIDVRRVAIDESDSYNNTMSEHLSAINELNERIGWMLAAFLAPQGTHDDR